MSDLAYFEYVLRDVERYLIVVNIHDVYTRHSLEQGKIDDIAKESLAMAIRGRSYEIKDCKPNPIPASYGQTLNKVQKLLTRPDSMVYLLE